MNAVDTNVFIYAVDGGEPIKHARAIELLASLDSDETVTPWQVACEMGAVLRRHQAKGRFSGDLTETLRALRGRFQLVMPTEEVLDRGLALMREAQLSYWDSLLIAACLESGVSRLYTEDLPGNLGITGLAIVNPFATV